MLAISYLLLDEVLSCANEVVEVILSLVLSAALRPVQSFFATATDMSDYKNSPEVFEKGQVLDRKLWLLAGAESSIRCHVGKDGGIWRLAERWERLLLANDA